jgi:hypothetical protein
MDGGIYSFQASHSVFSYKTTTDRSLRDFSTMRAKTRPDRPFVSEASICCNNQDMIDIGPIPPNAVSVGSDRFLP